MNIATGDGPRSTSAAVVLEHTGGADGAHFDWLVERPGSGDDRRLAAFRLLERPDRVLGTIHATRIRDHRALYLGFQGDLGRGLGRVRRLARGVCLLCLETPGRIEWIIDWGAGPRRCLGVPEDPPCWRFTIDAPP